MSFWLLQTLSDVDTDLVERAAQPPAVKEHRPARKHVWMSIVAAAACVALVVGMWQGGLFAPNTPPKVEAPNYDTNTTPTENTTTEPTSGGEGDGMGGDEKACDIHEFEYHAIDGRLIDYVGEKQWDKYYEQELSGDSDRIYDYTYLTCPYPESNIIRFLEYFEIPREKYIELMGWEDYLDKPFHDGLPSDEDGPTRPYTFGQWVDALYGGDPVLSEWVLNWRAKSEYDDYQYYYYDDLQTRTHDRDPLYTYVVSRAEWDGYDPIEYFSYEDVDKDDGLYAFLQFCGVTKEEFIDVYGWGDKLDKKATDHYKYAPYTYGQYVDAVYGGDETLRSWLFNKNVFHPEYPTLEEYVKLSEGDRFYEPAPPIAEVERVQLCHDHNPMYHRFDNFDRKFVQSFRRFCSDRDPEEFNIVNFMTHMKQYDGKEFAWDYGFDLRKKTRNNIAVDHGEGCPYTYWQFYLAVWGSDAELTEWVFAPVSTWPQTAEWPPTGEWPPEGYGYEREVTCTQHKPAYHDLSYFPTDKVEEYKKAVGYDNTEAHNVIDFINYYGIPYYSFPYYLGFDWQEDPAMERIAVEFGKDVTFTYRQFLDAIYGDDPELTAKVFGTNIASVTATTTRDPNWGRDENGNTTTRPKGSTTLPGHRP